MEADGKFITVLKLGHADEIELSDDLDHQTQLHVSYVGRGRKERQTGLQISMGDPVDPLMRKHQDQAVKACKILAGRHEILTRQNCTAGPDLLEAVKFGLSAMPFRIGESNILDDQLQ